MKTQLRLILLALSGTLALQGSNAATFLVSSTTDSGPGSLRQAILDANAAIGDDVIEFAVTGTITLASALPAITDNTTITGPGTNLLTISGNHSVRVFAVNADTTNTISGLTIADALATGHANGAGISNAGTLTLSDCAFINNQNLGGWGGAVFNSGDLSVSNSTFSGNQAAGENGYAGGNIQTEVPGAGGGGAGLGGGFFHLSGSALVRNCSFISKSATGGNGGSSTGGTGRGGGIHGGVGGLGFNDIPGDPGGFGCGGGGGGYGARHGGQGGFGGGGGGGDGAGGFGGGEGGGIRGYFGRGGGGGGGAGIGGGIFVNTGTVTLLDCSFSGNQAVGGGGGTSWGNLGYPGGDGSGIGPDFFNNVGRIIPRLIVATRGGGSVIAEPAAPPYLSNSLATVTATPSPGWSLIQWLGDASGTNTLLGQHVDRDKFIQAVFATQLDYSSPISVSPLLPLYPYGTSVKLTAIPPLGSYFASWSGAVAGTNNPVNLSVTNPMPAIACELGSLGVGETALTIIENGNGQVAVFPRKNRYYINETAGLVPVPDAGQEFIGWSGDASGTASPLLIPMTQSRVITANFTKRPRLQVGTPIEGLVPEGFRLTLLGEFAGAYEVEGSTNLTDWSAVGSVTNIYGIVQLTDPTATNMPYRFYRAVSE